MSDAEITELVQRWREMHQITAFAELWIHFSPYLDSHIAHCCDSELAREYNITPPQLMGATVALFIQALDTWDATKEVRFNTWVVVELRRLQRYVLHLVNKIRVGRGEKRIPESARRKPTEHDLHRQQAHPDYEYLTTENARKQSGGEPPENEGWEPNEIIAAHQYKDGEIVEEHWRNWERHEFTETNYWRRKRPAKETP